MALQIKMSLHGPKLDQSANDVTPQAANAVYLCVTDKGGDGEGV